MVVKFYIWEPTGEAQSYGHVAVAFGDGKYVSWWPKEPASLFKQTVDADIVKSLVEDISKEGGMGPKTYTLIDLNEDSMSNWWTCFASQPNPKWSLMSLNCATVAHKALCEGHIFFSRYQQSTWKPKCLESVVVDYMANYMGGSAWTSGRTYGISSGKKKKKIV